MIQKIPLIDRNCDLCSGDQLEPLWEYSTRTRTRTKTWQFDVHNVICRDCGFVFLSPVLDGGVLQDYYADSFAMFAGQALDYSVDKRIQLLRRHFPRGAQKIIELGSNTRSQFHSELERLFSDVLTVEPNQGTERDFSSSADLEGISCDAVAHYFVLEHVPDLPAFLESCRRLLAPQGLMIIEVPDLNLYQRFISPLMLFEHVNHFTPGTLAAIAARFGFSLVETSTELCSRDFGFASVFRKTDTAGVAESFRSEYKKNKIAFAKGMEGVAIFEQSMKAARSTIFDATCPTLLWAANESMARTLNGDSPPNNSIIIDSDSRKKDFFDGVATVYQPHEAWEQIQKAERIFLFTRTHADSIIRFLQTEFGKEFPPEKITVVDML